MAPEPRVLLASFCLDLLFPTMAFCASRSCSQIQKIEDATGYNLKALRIVNTVVFLLAFCHILACIFYALAIATAEGPDPPPKTWVTFFDGGYIEEPSTPLFDAYIIAYLWAIGLVCGQNTNITPESMVDRIESIVVYLFATLFFAYIIAVVTDQLQAYVNDPRGKAIDDLTLFTRFHDIDAQGEESLGKRLTQYFTTYYASRSMVDEEEILSNLTPSLRDEVMDHLLSSTVRICPLLHPADIAEERVQKFQEAVYAAIKPVGYAKKDLVLAKVHNCTYASEARSLGTCMFLLLYAQNHDRLCDPIL